MNFPELHLLAPQPRVVSLLPQGVKEFKCEVCGREFTLQANMKRHMLIHTSVRPYQCHICFKTFVQKQTLKTHMIVHSPVKPFKCKVWDIPVARLAAKGVERRAGEGRSLRTAEVVLLGDSERGERCELQVPPQAPSEQMFLSHSVVSEDQRTRGRDSVPCAVGADWPGCQVPHSPLVPSLFQVCGKSFNRMYNLLGHMHLHAGSKPFKCPYCSSKFNLKGNLSRHMKVKHGVMDISLDSQGGWAVRSGQSRIDSSMAHSGVSSPIRGVGGLAKAETSMRWAQVWREGEPGEPLWQ